MLMEQSGKNIRRLRKREAGVSGQGQAKIDGIIAVVMAAKLAAERRKGSGREIIQLYLGGAAA